MSESLIYRGRKFRVVEVQEPDCHGHPRSYEVIRHPGAVVVVPFVDEGHVCLIRNYRVAIGEELIELPAGTREPGEAPEVTARRELLEETGFVAENLVCIREFFPSPGILDERMFLFAARGLTSGPSSREPGEKIENLIVEWSAATQMVADQRIRDAKTIIGLLLCDQLRTSDL